MRGSRKLRGPLSAALMACLFAAGCSRPARFAPSATRVDGPVEFDLVPDHPVPLLLTDDDTFFLVDTAATFTTVADARAERAGLRVDRVRPFVVRDAAGVATRVTRVAHVPEFALGSVRFGSFDVVLPRSKPRGRPFPPDREATLGISLFSDCVLTLDYPRGKMLLSPAGAATADAAESIPLRRGVGRSLEAEIRIDGERVWALIDSGDDAGLSLPPRLSQRLPFKRPPVLSSRRTSLRKSWRSRTGRLAADVRVGPHTVREPIVTIDPHAEMPVLGGGLLRHFRWTIDQKSNRLYAARDTTDPIIVPSLVSYAFGYRRSVDALVVTDVVPESFAAAAGVRQGDEIVRIDGRAAAAAADVAEDLRGRAAAGNVVSLQVRRAGVIVGLEVRPTVLVE